jgi:hypothetical protein
MSHIRQPLLPRTWHTRVSSTELITRTNFSITVVVVASLRTVSRPSAINTFQVGYKWPMDVGPTAIVSVKQLARLSCGHYMAVILVGKPNNYWLGLCLRKWSICCDEVQFRHRTKNIYWLFFWDIWWSTSSGWRQWISCYVNNFCRLVTFCGPSRNNCFPTILGY